MKNDFKPVILKYKIKDTSKWKELDYKVFHNDSSDWKNFVWNMRQINQYSVNLKDWIHGPVADGGLLSVNYEDIKAYNNKSQLAVLTAEAVQYLQIQEVIEC